MSDKKLKRKDRNRMKPKIARRAVEWRDAARRNEWESRYVCVGGIPRILQEQIVGDGRTNRMIRRALSQCCVLTRREESEGAGGDQRNTAMIIQKILQRGEIPWVSLRVEAHALEETGLMKWARKWGDSEAETGWEWKTGTSCRTELGEAAESVLANTSERGEFSVDKTLTREALYDSHREELFLEQWVKNTLGGTAGHWFIPQADLDSLLNSAGISEQGKRRIDFLLAHPGCLMGVEIDGEEHAASASVDKARDRAMREIGIEVLRIPNRELEARKGPTLKQLEERYKKGESRIRKAGKSESVGKLARVCAQAAQVQWVIADRMWHGKLTGDRWEITVEGLEETGQAAIEDILDMMESLDALYGTRTAPGSCIIKTTEGKIKEWTNGRELEEKKGICSLHIKVDGKASSYQDIGETDADIVLRPAWIPVDISTSHTGGLVRRKIEGKKKKEIEKGLVFWLQTVFRKRAFRPMQRQAVENILRGRDCVVLLPTGAGKSIIYQLAGMLSPGMTIVVDPIVALIEDQIEGLRKAGITRVAGLSREGNSQAEQDEILEGMRGGRYHFVLHSPERLQTPRYREALRVVTESMLVNLVVVDEAHCVSEWGHDFRPAYLGLGRRLRELCKKYEEKFPPTVIGLTGTASRAVLRDLLNELDIGQDDSRGVIRPTSFDRKELNFEIVRGRRGKDWKVQLQGMMNRLHEELGVAKSKVFEEDGEQTQSGIIFVRTVNGESGILKTQQAVAEIIRKRPVVYCGKKPKDLSCNEEEWIHQKKENAQAFKQNEESMLIATSAFGMGIDKANIRWTIHTSMPESLEKFYQEVGRAGRDGKKAVCKAVYNEYDVKRNDSLLDANESVEELQERSEQMSSRRTADNVTQSLYFHFNSFVGQEKELENIERVLLEIELGDRRDEKEVGFWRKEEGENALTPEVEQEKALVRLERMGIISDYQKDWGGRKFIITKEPVDENLWRKKLLEYVCTAQPARAKPFEEELNSIRGATPYETAVELGRLLIGFTYEVIERARRRAIEEVVELCRHAADDTEIRERLLDYLQEGVGSEHIHKLIRNEAIEWEAWEELIWKTQTPVEAGGLRGECIRWLESYPDHPALLLIRGFAEAMCSDHDENTTKTEIQRGIESALTQYRIPKETVEKWIERLFEQGRSRNRNVVLPLVLAVMDTGRNVGMDLVKKEETRNDLVSTVMKLRNFERSMQEMEGTVTTMKRYFDEKTERRPNV